MDKQLLTIGEVCRALNCGRTNVYKLVDSGQLKANKLGRKTVFTQVAVQELIESLPTFPQRRSPM